MKDEKQEKSDQIENSKRKGYYFKRNKYFHCLAKLCSKINIFIVNTLCECWNLLFYFQFFLRKPRVA